MTQLLGDFSQQKKKLQQHGTDGTVNKNGRRTIEYEIKLDVENDATEDEIKDVIEEAYMDDDFIMDMVNSTYDIKIRKVVGE